MANQFEWGPWFLVIAGAACVPLSSVLYPQYLAVMRWLLPSQDKLKQIKPTLARQTVNTLLSFVMFAVGVVWLWLTGKVRL